MPNILYILQLGLQRDGIFLVNFQKLSSFATLVGTILKIKVTKVVVFLQRCHRRTISDSPVNLSEQFLKKKKILV